MPKNAGIPPTPSSAQADRDPGTNPHLAARLCDEQAAMACRAVRSSIAKAALPSLALEKAHRIERRRAPADLEVQLRRVDIAGLARVRNYLPALDLVTTLHQQFLGMRVDGGVVIRVADEDKVALARKSIACIAD